MRTNGFKCLLCVRQAPLKALTCLILTNTLRQVIQSSPFYREGNSGLERSCDCGPAGTCWGWDLSPGLWCRPKAASPLRYEDEFGPLCPYGTDISLRRLMVAAECERGTKVACPAQGQSQRCLTLNMLCPLAPWESHPGSTQRVLGFAAMRKAGPSQAYCPAWPLLSKSWSFSSSSLCLGSHRTPSPQNRPQSMFS